MVNKEFNKIICHSYPKIIDDLTNYFVTHNKHNIPVNYLVTEFINKYHSIYELEQGFNKLKTEENSLQDDDFGQHHRATKENNNAALEYKSVYQGYICCPYCGNTKVPLTSHICTVCSAGLA